MRKSWIAGAAAAIAAPALAPTAPWALTLGRAEAMLAIPAAATGNPLPLAPGPGRVVPPTRIAAGPWAPTLCDCPLQLPQPALEPVGLELPTAIDPAWPANPPPLPPGPGGGWPPLAAPVPEPSAWLLMISGFGLAGLALRRRARTCAPM
jgi:hypothetical protein